MTVTSSCPNGEPMLSGGYAASGGADFQHFFVGANYPSSSSAWTVTVANIADSPLTLTVYADCLQANFSITTQIAVNTQTTPNGGVAPVYMAQCPAGATATGGGYVGEGLSSAPAMTRADEWQASFYPHGTAAHVYAICTGHNLLVAGTPSDRQSVTTGGTAKLSTGCSSGTVLVGGGYQYDGLFGNAFADAPSDDFTSWEIQFVDQDFGSGTSGLTSFAVCSDISSLISWN